MTTQLSFPLSRLRTMLSCNGRNESYPQYRRSVPRRSVSEVVIAGVILADIIFTQYRWYTAAKVFSLGFGPKVGSEHLVFLSGLAGSRREAAAESKDLY
jgi:hypothetical protein